MSSDPHVRQYVESSDCVLMLGTFITDMNMGIYTAKLDRSRSDPGDDRIDQRRLSPVRRSPIQRLPRRPYASAVAAIKSLKPKKFRHPNPHSDPKPLAKIRTDRCADHARSDAHRLAEPG